MAHYPSAFKRIRQNERRRLRNRYQRKTTRTFIRKLRESQNKEEAEKLFQQVSSMLDKLAKKNLIHKKNASNQKSKLARLVNGLS